MIVLGITGGIGSGKTTVCNMFKSIGIPVYNSDYEAKELMQSSNLIRAKICSRFGEEAYLNGTLNKHFISKKIFKQKNLLKEINNIVHPEVSLHFNKWLSSKKSIYVIKEIAILFELSLENQFDYILTVTAPENKRIERVINRDKKSIDEVKSIINNQLKDSKKINKSDFVINNICLNQTLRCVYEIHNKIINNIQ